MAARSNAIQEITRFWLQAKHGCLVYESLPVPVRYNQSDIDLLAIKGNLGQIELPGGLFVGPRLIVETKDEHDWEPTGQEYGHLLESDAEKIGEGICVPRGIACKFSMLREEHYDIANDFFGTDDFDRLFVVHAVNSSVLDRYRDYLSSRRIHFITIRDLIDDLYAWYQKHPRRAGLRYTITGDIWHLHAIR